MSNSLYIDNTQQDFASSQMFHPVVVAAIKNNGVFDDDFSDLFSLTNLGPINDDGSNCWVLDMADDS